MNLKKQRGQGMTEYILLVALIAIAAIAAVKYFGAKTKEGFETAADAVGGVNQGMAQAGSAKDAAVNQIAKQAKK
jgi:Flp pilus assembly pilin Flp